jgi:hypothetical protein
MARPSRKRSGQAIRDVDTIHELYLHTFLKRFFYKRIFQQKQFFLNKKCLFFVEKNNNFVLFNIVIIFAVPKRYFEFWQNNKKR